MTRRIDKYSLRCGICLCKSDDDACAYANMMMMLVLVRTMLANLLMFVLMLACNI
jgi:hypothetical protein